MLLTPSEILSEFPHIKKVWTCGDIGYLLHLGLVTGKKLKKTCVVDSREVKALFEQVKKK